MWNLRRACNDVVRNFFSGNPPRKSGIDSLDLSKSKRETQNSVYPASSSTPTPAPPTSLAERYQHLLERVSGLFAASAKISEVLVNSSGLPCKHLVKYQPVRLKLLAPSNTEPTTLQLHGHEDVFRLALPKGGDRGNSPNKPLLTTLFPAKTTVAAQSPDTGSTSAGRQPGRDAPALEWLHYAMQTQKTQVVQFVTRLSHRDGHNGTEKPLMTQLKEIITKCPAGIAPSVQIDGQNFTLDYREDHQDIQWDSNDKKSGEVYFKTATVRLTNDRNQSHEFQLKQIAPPFKNRLLKAEDLASAHAIVCSTVKNNEARKPTDAIPTDSIQGNPLDHAVVFSYSGYGRNASLMVYSQLVRLIDNRYISDENQLNDELVKLTHSGKQVRGVHFVQSVQQFEEIAKAAKTYLDTHLSKQETRKEEVDAMTRGLQDHGKTKAQPNLPELKAPPGDETTHSGVQPPVAPDGTPEVNQPEEKMQDAIVEADPHHAAARSTASDAGSLPPNCDDAESIDDKGSVNSTPEQQTNTQAYNPGPISGQPRPYTSDSLPVLTWSFGGRFADVSLQDLEHEASSQEKATSSSPDPFAEDALDSVPNSRNLPFLVNH